MIRHPLRNDEAFTGLELIVILVIIVVVAIVLLAFLNGGDITSSRRTFPGGLVAESMYISGDNIQPVGNVYAFPSVSRISGKPPVIFSHEDPGKLGVVRVIVSLFIGDTGAIDMDRVQVRWNRREGQELLSESTASMLVCPNWTISDKFNMLPGRNADSDNWLEPGEQFEILLCPQEGIPPYGTFTLVFSPDGSAAPLSISRTAPFNIQPVMNLG